MKEKVAPLTFTRDELIDIMIALGIACDFSGRKMQSRFRKIDRKLKLSLQKHDLGILFKEGGDTK